MLSRTIPLPAGPCPPELLRVAQGAERAPDLVLAFLPPDDSLEGNLEAVSATWPSALAAGCEAVTQFADDAVTASGSLQLFWFEMPDTRCEARVIEGSRERHPTSAQIAGLAREAAAADGVLLLVDGLRFPTEPFLADLRRHLPPGATTAVAGGLASQAEPVDRPGARVFLRRHVLPPACLALLLFGVEVRLEIVRGWDPASPVYSVTRAAGNVLHEIDGEPATDWYRRFFTVAGQLAPLPEAAHRFPLILEGPGPDRQGLYRSMRFFDEPPGAVTYWGTIETGDRVRLGMGNDHSLLETAERLPSWLRPQAAILYSCVGRQAVLGAHAGLETTVIHRALGGTALSGFFTFGEIGPTPHGILSFYNQTAILVLLSETRS